MSRRNPIYPDYRPDDARRRRRWEYRLARRVAAQNLPRLDPDTIPVTRCRTITGSYIEHTRHGARRVEVTRPAEWTLLP